MSESHGAAPGETAAVPATDPDEMKDAISAISPQEETGDESSSPATESTESAERSETVVADSAGQATANATGQEPVGDGADQEPEVAQAGEEPEGAEAGEESEVAHAGEEPAAEEVPEEPTYQRFDCTGADFSAGAEAARLAIERGECVVLPTDTVYGIGADAFSAEAVQRLLDAKERGRDMPPPVLISDTQMFKALATDIPQAALDLVERFWPGGLTVICTAHANLDVDLGDTEGTIALRVPDHALARDLLRQTGPLAVSSANLTGHPSALSVDEAIDMLGNAVSVYLDGGRLADPADEEGTRGLPSTMVDFTHNEHGEVLRAGAISTEVLQEVVPDLVGPKTIKPLGSAADLAAAINALRRPEPEPEGEPSPEPSPDETPGPEPDGAVASEDPAPANGAEPSDRSTDGDDR